jgi:hypothetical protein
MTKNRIQNTLKKKITKWGVVHLNGRKAML